MFQKDLDHLGEWCRSNRFDPNAGKCKSISLRRNFRPIDGTVLEKVDEIKDLGVMIDKRISFLPHIEAIISKSSRTLGLNKRISIESND
jgi:hypothetical protein